ncbi:MAG: hypothetical protein LBT48_05725 [Prevotellaceae bacterium]|jgi:hypothetical protein|nr:hypothetical protein [Prevotellaceae bacterium]
MKTIAKERVKFDYSKSWKNQDFLSKKEKEDFLYDNSDAWDEVLIDVVKEYFEKELDRHVNVEITDWHKGSWEIAFNIVHAVVVGVISNLLTSVIDFNVKLFQERLNKKAEEKLPTNKDIPQRYRVHIFDVDVENSTIKPYEDNL